MLLNCGVGEDSWESLRLARRFNQSILKISPGCSLEGLMLKLKLQYIGHLMGSADSLEKTQMLEKIEGRRRSGKQRMRWLGDITDSMDMGWVDSDSWWWTGRPGVLWFMGSQRFGHNWMTKLTWTYSLRSSIFIERNLVLISWVLRRFHMKKFNCSSGA